MTDYSPSEAERDAFLDAVTAVFAEHRPVSSQYGIASLAEATAYLDHDVLGPRLRECAQLVGRIEGSSADEVFGWPDNLKVRSSMTLFAHATADDADFRAVLDRFYDGVEDPLTVEQLAR